MMQKRKPLKSLGVGKRNHNPFLNEEKTTKDNAKIVYGQDIDIDDAQSFVLPVHGNISKKLESNGFLLCNIERNKDTEEQQSRIYYIKDKQNTLNIISSTLRENRDITKQSLLSFNITAILYIREYFSNKDKIKILGINKLFSQEEIETILHNTISILSKDIIPDANPSEIYKMNIVNSILFEGFEILSTVIKGEKDG